MTIPKKALDGLSMWALMFGQEYVTFGELDDADMLQFFVLSKYTDDKYLQQGTATYARTTYRLTDKALQAIREAV
jgi:hypothetical protein